MSEFAINTDMFGKYVRIPTGYSRAKHIYKVVSHFQSNTYCDVPIVASSIPVPHVDIEHVLNVIHCGIDESKVICVALKDCEMVKMPSAHYHGRWNLCSERMPKKYGRVITCDQDENVYAFICDGKYFFDEYNRVITDEHENYYVPIAWMPMPKPYKGE